MRRAMICLVGAALTAPVLALPGQVWGDPRALDLVRRATDRRVQQLSDSGLIDYRATAHGYVTFLAQLGERFRTPPKVVKADELVLEVYWRSPNLSKQRIVGRRDTTLLPTDIAYHRDHLGIVQNNFPAIIRIGDGDEVRDVPHPLSAEGLRQYQFALTDSLRITAPGRVIDLYELKVRPIDDQQPRFVGAVYVERANAQVVRMAFGFTRSAYLDKQLEDVFVVLENGLVGTSYWLPRRQEIEIRRKVQWMDYPARGIIRGRWDIANYSLNVETPRAEFVGPEIVEAPREVQRNYPWASGRIVDSLPPESQLPTPTEILRVQEEARTLVRKQAIDYGRAKLAARSASDFLRFDRNSGFSIGGGVGAQLTRQAVLEARGAYGFADERRRGAATLRIRPNETFGFSLFVSEDERDVGDVVERSSLVNSLAAQEFGSDFSDRYAVRMFGIGLAAQFGHLDWTILGTAEEHHSIGVHASAFRGDFRPAFNAVEANVRALTLRVEKPMASGWFGTEWRGSVELRTAAPPVYAQDNAPCNPLALTCGTTNPSTRREALQLEVERPFGDARLVTRTFAAAAQDQRGFRAQDLVFLGGPVSAPGFGFHDLVGDRAVSQQIELQIPAPFPSFSLGRFGRTSSRALLTPHWTVVALHRVPASTTIQRGPTPIPSVDPLRPRATGEYHAVGIGLTTFFDLIKLDVSRELPHGRWLFSVDVARAFWPIL
jgi:hypothetical protein